MLIAYSSINITSRCHNHSWNKRASGFGAAHLEEVRAILPSYIVTPDNKVQERRDSSRIAYS